MIEIQHRDTRAGRNGGRPGKFITKSPFAAVFENDGPSLRTARNDDINRAVIVVVRPNACDLGRVALTYGLVCLIGQCSIAVVRSQPVEIGQLNASARWWRYPSRVQTGVRAR